MKRDIDIDALMAETWLTVAQLRYQSIAPDGEALYKRCTEQVESIREALERAGYDQESITHITYAQCALLDEAVMNRKVPEEQATARGEEAEKVQASIDDGIRVWKKAPLQARYFNSLRAGGAIYERIEQVLRQSSPEQAVLTCYQRVLALGFQGQYSLEEGQSGRDDIIQALNARVPALGADVSLVVHKRGKRRYNLLRSVWFWIILAVILTMAVWFGGHLWLQQLLHQQLPELH
ncbi:TPA: DotU family type IV/VI secretion system protein [Enterobacter hormaechei subsp. steigerwaltii]|nr:DotU family type IV/VI secretion system protein [Enterobacter hormaechei subsp. steigerwaltii]